MTTVENKVSTAELTHAFSDNTTLTVSGRLFDSNTDDYGSFISPDLVAPDAATPTVYPIFALYLPTTVRETTLDANLATSVNAWGGQHQLLAGINYDNTSHRAAEFFNTAPIGTLDLAAPNYALNYALPQFISTQTDRYQTTAAYLQDQATYGRFHLLGSLRITQLALRQAEQNVDETYHHITPRAGITYDLTPGVSLYAAYATGFRGAIDFIGLVPPRPETSRNDEGGVKLALNGLSGTVAVFDQTRRNVSTPDPANPLSSIQTGAQRACGLETDLAWALTAAFSVLANYAYTQAQVTEDTTLPVGDTLPRVPRQSARLAAHYRVLDGVAEGLSFGAGVTAYSARELTLPNNVAAPGYALVDAQASYHFDRYTLALSAINLTGRKTFDPYPYLGTAVVIPVQPRSACLTLTVHL